MSNKLEDARGCPRCGETFVQFTRHLDGAGAQFPRGGVPVPLAGDGPHEALCRKGHRWAILHSRRDDSGDTFNLAGELPPRS